MASDGERQRVAPAPGSSRATPRTRWILLVMVLAYFAVSLTLSIARYWDFYTSNYDLGSYEQALWSFSHGQGFFDSADYSLEGATSFLSVHPALIMYPLAGLYAAFPGPWLLFVIQSAVVAAAAIPIFLLTRDATRSEGSALLAAGLYLVWAPTLAGTLSDFHLEAFLPLELLTLFLFWSRRQYLWGVLVAGAAFATFEAGPPFVFLIGLYFLLPADPVLRDWWNRLRTRPAASPPGNAKARPRTADSEARSIQVKWSVGLMVASIAASLLLLAYQQSFPYLPGAYGNNALSGLSASGFPQVPVAMSQLSTNFVLKVAYWVVIYGLVAFLPARAPRSFILAAPWIVVTFFADTKFTTFGLQYVFVSAMPVFVGVAYGMVGLRWRVPTVSQAPAIPVETPSASWRKSPLLGPTPWAIAVMVAIVANLLLSPVNPLTQQPGSGIGYNVSLSFQPGYESLEQLLEAVPPGAQIVASDNLFPFVANNLHAYGLLKVPFPAPFLPFNASHPPTYVLLSEAELGDVPVWLYNLLQPPSPYGLRGTVGQTPVGIVELFEFGYQGPSEDLGPAGFAATTFWPPQIGAGAAGQWVTDTSVHFPYVVESLPGATGNIWFGPYVGLPSGAYEATAAVRFTLPPGGLPPPLASRVLAVDFVGFGLSPVTRIVLLSALITPDVWVTVAFSFSLAHPTPQVQVRGFQVTPGYIVELGALTLSPTT